MSSFRAASVLASMLIFAVPAGAFAAEGGPSSNAIAPTTILLLVVQCLLIALASIFGGFVPMIFRMTHTRMQLLVSFVGGLMLGVGFFHQLPHAIAVYPVNVNDAHGGLDWCIKCLMAGLLATFFMLRMFHFHSHEPMAEDGELTHDGAIDHHHDHDHAHDHGHHHDHDCAHDHGGPPGKNAGWIGIFLGLSLHTLLDGIALAAAVQADALHNHGDKQQTWFIMGFGTFLGVALHKPLDSLSITSLMATGGWSRRAIQLVNVIYAMMCPFGAALFCLGIQTISGSRDFAVASALAMSAGVFICISLSDLLPEVQFHSHDRLRLSVFLIAGIIAAWAIGLAEPEHSHGKHGTPAIPGQVNEQDHNHNDHHH